MKILVIADSHTNKENLILALESAEYDKIIFAGDGIKDLLSIENIDRDKLILVKGNNDITNIVPTYVVSEIEGKRFFITHGHEYNVKYGLKKLLETANKEKADVVIYAHTHIATQIKLDNGVVCINPGSVGKGRLGQNTFAVIDISAKDNIFNCNICAIV